MKDHQPDGIGGQGGFAGAICAAIVAGMALAGCNRSPGTASDDNPVGPVSGREIYTANCQACHQPDGRGLPGKFPPLAGSKWVNGSQRRLIALSLDGVMDTLNVKGAKYPGVMPAWRNTLNDARIAAVLTYIRQSWGNASPPVSALDVSRVRTDTATRKTFWTSRELMELDAGTQPKGIPASGTAGM